MRFNDLFGVKTKTNQSLGLLDVIAELRKQGESIPSEFKCPNCQHYYHPEPLTLNAARMLLDHSFDPHYNAVTDHSPIVCPGSEYSRPQYSRGGTNATLFGTFLGNVDFDTDTIKVMLCTSKYVPMPHHTYKSDVTNEISGMGYTAGGIQLCSTTVGHNPYTGAMTFDAADVCWPHSNICARYAIVYQDYLPGYLISCINFGADVVSNGGNFMINWDSAGIFSGQLI